MNASSAADIHQQRRRKLTSLEEAFDAGVAEERQTPRLQTPTFWIRNRGHRRNRRHVLRNPGRVASRVRVVSFSDFHLWNASTVKPLCRMIERSVPVRSSS
jgi:hypothetical protein